MEGKKGGRQKVEGRAGKEGKKRKRETRKKDEWKEQ